MNDRLTAVDVFSGIGAFALASRWLGIETIALCEIDPFCQRVLQKNFPGVPISGDVNGFTDWFIRAFGDRRPDIITGGFPCTDLSVAGKQEGLAGDRSGLWFAMLAVCIALRPALVIVENVPGIYSAGGLGGERAIDTVVRGLSEAGYVVATTVLSAGNIGAPHERERVFILGVRIALAPGDRVRWGSQSSKRVLSAQWLPQRAGGEAWTEPQGGGSNRGGILASARIPRPSPLGNGTTDAECGADRAGASGQLDDADRGGFPEGRGWSAPEPGGDGANDRLSLGAGAGEYLAHPNGGADSGRRVCGAGGGRQPADRSGVLAHTPELPVVRADATRLNGDLGREPGNLGHKGKRRGSRFAGAGSCRSGCRHGCEPAQRCYPACCRTAIELAYSKPMGLRKRRAGDALGVSCGAESPKWNGRDATAGPLPDPAGQPSGDAFSDLDRGPHGIPHRVDRGRTPAQERGAFPRSGFWPQGKGTAQHAWEPARTVPAGYRDRPSRLKSLGNSIVPQVAAIILATAIESALAFWKGNETNGF